MNELRFKKGGVSMFLVVIAGLFIALVVASFIRIVTRDSIEAINQDLSQSAYDSAQAGVEDAKIFIARLNKECSSGGNSINCQKMKAVLNRDDCNMLVSVDGGLGVGSASGETKIQTDIASDSKLDQAYTCLKIQTQTPDFLGSVSEYESKTIKLKGVSSFDRISLSWHSEKNLSNPSSNIDLASGSVLSSNNFELPDIAEWNRKNRPAILKAQFYGYKGGGLSNLDTPFSGDGNGLSEQLYYPTANVGGQKVSRLSSDRRSKTISSVKNFTPVKCNSVLNGDYACNLTIELGHQVAAGDEAFLRLSTFYTGADFKVQLKNGDSLVYFNEAQIKVDSNGRANDMFRRVESRLEIGSDEIPAPDFAVNIDGDSPLCKDFAVTYSTNTGLSCSL